MSNGIKAKNKKDKFFTIEFFGVTIIVASFMLLVCLLFGEKFLFELSYEVQCFLLGLFGYLSYPVLLTLILIGFIMLLGKKQGEKRSKKPVIYTVSIIFLITCLLTVLTNKGATTSLNSYTSYAFESARGGLSTSVAGGALLSLVTFYAVSYLTTLGSIILFVVLTAIVIVIAYKSKKSLSQLDKELKIAKIHAEAQANANANQNANANGNGYVQPQINQPQYNQPQFNQPNYYGYGNVYNQNPNFNGNNQPSSNVDYRQSGYARQVLYGNPENYQPTDSNGVMNGQSQFNQSPTFTDQQTHDKNMQILYGNQTSYLDSFANGFTSNGERSSIYNEEKKPNNFDLGVSSPIKKEEPVKDLSFDEGFSFSYSKAESDDFNEVTAEEIDFSELQCVADDDEVQTQENVSDYLKNLGSNSVNQTQVEVEPQQKQTQTTVEVEQDNGEYAKKLIENMPINYKYKKPPVSLFKTIDNSQNNYEFEIFKAEIKARILTTLKTFGVDTDIPRVFKGPAVTRFDIAIPPNISMSKVTKLQDDLNLRIAAKSAIRMIAPIPNTSYVGIEVPNKEPDSVSIKDILVSDEFINTKPFSLVFALGKDVIGKPVSLDIAEMPHLLVTGTTGSGKSVCLNALIVSLITKYGPDELRFVIVDPKRVDLEPFKDIPHMMFGEIIEDVPTTNSMLTWAVEEMESRYSLLAKSRAKNIKDYNTKARATGQKILPRIVILMDEFADIMLQDKKGVATKVCLIAQKARAAGIHLVLAAQRPSVDIIDGPIKSNLPSRIVFRASSMPDSMTSLGEAGAEKLLGRGDCLYRTNGMLNVERVMGAYVSDDEMYDVIDYVCDNNEKYYDYNNWAKIVARVSSTQASAENFGGDSSGEAQGEGGIDPIYIKAMRIGYSFGGLSASFLQRKLAVGFPRAGKIIDWLTDNGYITPNMVSGKRQMILTKEAFEEKFGAE